MCIDVRRNSCRQARQKRLIHTIIGEGKIVGAFQHTRSTSFTDPVHALDIVRCPPQLMSLLPTKEKRKQSWW